MLFMMDEARIPAHWALRGQNLALPTPAMCEPHDDYITIALVNNMPDAALEDTELQFFELLNAAAGEIPVRLKLFSLPGIPRGDRGTEHLNGSYFDIKDLLNDRFDGVIITGTEPHHSDLRQEPYWGVLTEVLEWTKYNSHSTVLSCLAAHASVLYMDGIERRPMGDKKFGVFEERKVFPHALTNSTTERIRFPHSRWNDVPGDELSSCGYTVLCESAEAGVNLFVKKKEDSLFVHFQGHPEYGAGTLAKEYRRDVRRYLKHERQTYPSLPFGYFDADATKALTEFREKALAQTHQGLMTSFPDGVIADGLESPWRASALGVYRNWLHYLAEGKGASSTLQRMASAGRG
ncbi:MAG: homoserine O-succinyltransferase MetA [Candidatus Acidiferrum sp.]